MKSATKLKTKPTEPVPIHHITSFTREQLATLDAKDLLRIQQETLARYREAQALKTWVEEAIALKYQDLSRTLRQQLGKETGTMHFDGHGVKITQQLPKRVEWDQVALAEIADQLRAHSQEVSRFMRFEYKISENDYQSWTEIEQNTFQRARTVKAGKSTWILSADATAAESIAIHPVHPITHPSTKEPTS
jgi:hypothetical protein